MGPVFFFYFFFIVCVCVCGEKKKYRKSGAIQCDMLQSLNIHVAIVCFWVGTLQH